MAGTYVDPMTEALIAYEGHMVSTDLSPYTELGKQYAVTAAVPCSDKQCGAQALELVLREIFPMDNPTPRIKPCAGCNRVEQPNNP